MKKLFTLIVSATLFTTAFAQYDHGDQKDDMYGKRKDIVANDNGYKKEDNRLNDNYSFNKRAIELQIMQINREYDYKIQSVKNKLFMSRFKKIHIISMLEDQRNDEIRMVYAKFNNKHERFDDKRSKGRW